MSRVTHVKLGIFAIAAIGAAIAAAAALGLHASQGKTVAYHTYFDESVQGLDLGASVKYRGVSIGTVSGIEIAPDHVHVDVELALHESAVDQLDLASAPPGARAQLSGQGLTGVKLIDIEFFDPAESPPPQLPFATAPRTIASRRSLMRGLATNLDMATERLPELLDRGTAALDKLDKLLGEVRDARIAAQLGDAIADVRRVVGSIDRARLPEQTARTLRDFDAAVARIDHAVAQVDGDRGLIASARRTTDTIGDSAVDVGRALRELGDAARAVRELAEAIERDPAMLVAGHARSKQP
jgi:ABC-type transporter Mla subunit MlaD